MRQHRYSVGQMVTLLPVMGTRTSRAMEAMFAKSIFEITRLLPREDASFHYRVKNAETGMERVAAENEIQLAAN